MENTNAIEPCATAVAIMDELDRQGRTRYWLMKQTELDSPTVYGFLQGSLDCRISTVERMMNTLGMACNPYETKTQNGRNIGSYKPQSSCCKRV